MTSNGWNTISMLRTTSDAIKEGTFDPLTRQIDDAGRSYVDFQAVLNGEPDPEDDCNAEIARHLKNGRSEAFCREYRIGWHLAYQDTRGQSIAAQLRANAPKGPQAVRAAFQNWKPKFSERRHIAAAAESRAKNAEPEAQAALDALEAEREAERFSLRTLARAAGALDAGNRPANR